MRAARTPIGTAGGVIGAVLVVVVVLAPTLLFGRSVSAWDLVVIGASVLGVGLLVRRAARGRARAFGTTLGALGAVILVLAIGLMAALLAGWGRGP